MVNALTDDQQAGYEHALAVLDSFDTLPSCARQAWSQLISTCSDLDTFSNTADSHEQVVDDVRSVFATRLAVCEIAAVSAELLPATCAILIKSDIGQSSSTRSKREQQTHHSFTSDSQLHHHHKVCLQDLFQDTRFWTSYSNSVQNARAICEASKKHIDKDEALHFHRSMLEVAKRGAVIHTSNFDNMHKLTEELKSLAAFVQNAQRLQANAATQTAEEMKEAFRPLFRFILEVGTDVQTNIKLLNDFTNAVHLNLEQQHLSQSTAMRAYAEHEAKAVNHFTLMSDLFAALHAKTLGITTGLGAIDASMQQMLPQIVGGLANLNKSAAIVDHITNKSMETSAVMNETGKMLKEFMVHQTAAHNQTMAFYNELNSVMSGSGSLFSLFSWILRTSWNWFGHLPSLVIAMGYFFALMSVAMLLTATGRKLASIPVSLITAPIRAWTSFLMSMPLPISLLTAHLAVYFGILEQPTEAIVRWTELNFGMMDLYLAGGVIVSVIVAVASYVRKQVIAAALGLPLEKVDYQTTDKIAV